MFECVCARRTLGVVDAVQVVEADVIVHIVDVSSPSREKQESAVTNVLDDMKVSDKPRLTMWNKLDLLPEEEQVCAGPGPSATLSLGYER